MSHYDEDIYKLEQAREMFRGMYNQRKQENLNDNAYDKKLGDAIKSVDEAISARKDEETKREVEEFYAP